MQIEHTTFGRHAAPTAGKCARPVKRCWRIVAGTLALCLSLSAAALEMDSLYTVEVAVDPDAADSQDIAFRDALAEVLVRVTGMTAIVESEQMATLFPNPRRYVSQYRPGPDDTLVILLDGPAIETVLRRSGVPVWGSDRPLTLVWIAIDRGRGEREIVAAGEQDRLTNDSRFIDRNRLLREGMLEIAVHRGIPMLFPLLDTEDLENISFSDIWGGFDDLLLQASLRYDAASVLVGRIRAESEQEDRWTWYHAGGRSSWYGEAEQIVHLMADSLAAQYALTGSEPIDIIRLSIAGINSLSAYGRVQRLMENLRGVEVVRINAVEGDRIVYDVHIQGGTERLQRALEMSDLLERIEPFDDAGGDNDLQQRSALEFLYRSD